MSEILKVLYILNVNVKNALKLMAKFHLHSHKLHLSYVILLSSRPNIHSVKCILCEIHTDIGEGCS